MKTTSTLNKLCKCPGVDQGTLLSHWCFKSSALPIRLQDRLLYLGYHTRTYTLSHTHGLAPLEQSSRLLVAFGLKINIDLTEL